MSVRVLQVSNISPFATKEQIQTLFTYVGRVEELKLYPSDFSLAQANQQPKFAFIKFEDERGVEVGQHLTNTVFLDRALVCVQGQSNTIPDEEDALQSGSLALPGQRQLPPHISNQVQDMGDGQKMIVTVDPNLASLGLPAYPPLPPTTEPAKVEEIRRTVYVGNLPKGCDGDELLNFFNACIGEVMYLRMAAGNEYLPCDYAYVEFSHQASVPLALQNSDTLDFQGHPLRIQHSKVAIIKPQRKTVEQSLEEVEEAIRGGAIGGVMDLGRGYSPQTAGGVAAATPAAPLSTATARAATRSRSPRSPRRSRDRDSSRSDRRRRRSRSRSRSSSPRSKRRSRSRSKKRRSSRRSRTPERSSRKRRSSSRHRSRSPRKRSSERKKSSKRSRSPRDRDSRKDKEKDGNGSSKKKDKERGDRDKGDKERSSRKEEKKDKERGDKDKSDKGEKEKDSKKERKRSRSPKKDKADREEKSSKKSKRTSDEKESPKKEKVKKEKEAPPPQPSDSSAEPPPPSSTHATPSSTAMAPSEAMDTTTTSSAAAPMVPVEKQLKKEPAAEFVEEEESLRERLLERVKIKQQLKSEED